MRFLFLVMALTLTVSACATDYDILIRAGNAAIPSCARGVRVPSDISEPSTPNFTYLNPSASSSSSPAGRKRPYPPSPRGVAEGCGGCAPERDRAPHAESQTDEVPRAAERRNARRSN